MRLSRERMTLRLGNPLFMHVSRDCIFSSENHPILLSLPSSTKPHTRLHASRSTLVTRPSRTAAVSTNWCWEAVGAFRSPPFELGLAVPLERMKAQWVCEACTRQLQAAQRRHYTNAPRDYTAAVAALNTLQSNFSAVEAIRKQGPGWNKRAIPEMIGWVRRIGYEVCIAAQGYTDSMC